MNRILLSFISFSFIGHAAIADDAGVGAAVPFTGRDAATVIGEALMRQDVGNDVKVTLNEAREDDIIAQASGPVSAEADNIELDKARGRWQATLIMKADGRNLSPVRLSGHYEEMKQVPVLKRRIDAGEVIAEDDIDMDREPLQRLRKNTITDEKDLVGKSPRHMISQGRAIRQDEIANPAVVNKGSQVTLYFRSGSIEIKTYGEAMDSGAKGDVIRVRNTTSKAIVQGTVESNQFVRVSAPGIDSAEAM